MEEFVRTVTGAVEMPVVFALEREEVKGRGGEGMPTFCPLAVRNIWGSRVVFVGGIVDVVPQFELTVRIQGPQLSRCVGFQPIRGHSSVTVGVTVESG